MGINYSGQYNEVDDGNYVAGTISVSTAQVEAKVGANALSNRQTLILYNASSVTMYVGPTGVTTTNGLRLEPGQEKYLSVGQAIQVYVIAGSAGPYTCVVQELA